MTDPHVLTEAAVLAAREVGGGVAAHGPVACGLELEGVTAALEARPAHFASVLAPGLAPGLAPAVALLDSGARCSMK